MAQATRTRGKSESKKQNAALSSQQVHSYPVPGLNKLSIAGFEIADADSPDESRRTFAFLTLARERFKLCADSEANRRKEALEDQRFRCGNQWRPDIKQKREAKGRPCHEINRMNEFLAHVVNNMRQSRPAIEIDPVGGGADEQQALIRQGIIQYIERISQADIAYDHSFEQMCTMGLGWMRVLSDWSDWDSFDQDLYIRWVENSFGVYSDPSAALPDWSDMQFAFVVEDMLPNEFNARYPGKSAASPDIFQSYGDDIAKYWYPAQKIRVAEYFYVEQTKDTLCELENGNNRLLSELPKGMYRSEDDRLIEVETGEDIGRTRECTVPTVKWAKITGVDILEERTWKGRYIPLIPVIGVQTMLEGEKILFGMVRFAREIQRMYNYIYSTLIEVIALAPRSQWIASIGQIDNFRDLYERSNYDPIAVLPYEAQSTPQGQPLPPPQRIGTEVQIQGLIAALQIVDNMLKSVFMIYDASLGQKGPQESGLAINARKIESETATYNWGDNFIRSLRYLGTVINDLLTPYYNKPGRIVQILQEDQKIVSVTLNQAYTPQGQTEPVIYDLSKGKYAVAVSTGPSALTLRKEAATQMGELLKADPQLFQIFGDIFIEEQDWPGKAAIAARLKKMLPPQLQDNEGQPKPPDPQMVQLQQMVQVLSQKLHEALDKKDLEKMKEEYDTFRNTQDNITQLLSADVKAGMQQAEFLNQRVFEQLDHIRGLVLGQLQQGDDQAQPGAPGGQPQAAPGQPVQSGAPQPVLAGPQTGGG